METNNDQNEVVLPERDNEMGPIGRIIGVVLSPKNTFESISRKPDWLVPFIFILLLTALLGYLMQPVILSETRKAQQEKLEKKGASQEEIDQVLEKTSFMKYLTIPSAIFILAINFLITTLIWWFVGNIVLGGESDFKKVFSVNVYRSIIPTVGGIIKLPIILSKGTLLVSFGPAIALSEESKDTFLYKFLGQLDLFNIWMIAALCIGLAVIYKFKITKIWPVVAVLYLGYYLVVAGLSSLF